MDEMQLMHDIAYRVRKYVPGSLEWIAKQDDTERDDLYGFVIGHGFASVTIEQARNADETLIRSLAAQILGFEVDSTQDLKRRRDEAVEQMDKIDDQIEVLRMQRKYWVHRRLEAISRLSGIPEDQVSVELIEAIDTIRKTDPDVYRAAIAFLETTTDEPAT